MGAEAGHQNSPQLASSEAASSSVPEQPPVDIQKKLHELVDILSPYECEHLYNSVNKVVVGDRFWEDDAAIFYNEYVKSRYSTYVRNPQAFLGGDPPSKDGIYASVPIEKSYDSAEQFALPPPEPVSGTLQEVLERRRSRRDYSDTSLSTKQLSTLLHHGYGTTGRVSAYGYNDVTLRTAPSSGALQSTELYFFAQNVDGLKPGLYHFRSAVHGVELIRSGFDASIMRAWVPGQPLAAGAPIIFVFTGCYERLRWKYGARSYRYMCMDIGFVCENLYLAAESMGLAFCAVAGFMEDELEGYLQIDGQSEMALLVASLGLRSRTT